MQNFFGERIVRIRFMLRQKVYRREIISGSKMRVV